MTFNMNPTFSPLQASTSSTHIHLLCKNLPSNRLLTKIHGSRGALRLPPNSSHGARREADLVLCMAKKTTIPDASQMGDQEPGFWAKVGKLLRDFGMGRRSVMEGGVGAFLLGGAVLACWLMAWAQGFQARRGRSYQATIVFPQASGISVGTPVRIRGVAIGSAQRVLPKLDGVEVTVEVTNDSTVIPKNSAVEANQSGLIAEPFVDITPQLPIPDNKSGPLDADCEQEGLIVCNGGRIQGGQGVSLDDLVYICTKLAIQMDSEGIDTIFRAADSLADALDTAQPLIKESASLVEEITPLLKELKDRGMVDNLDQLSKSVADATKHLEELERAILDEKNVKALKESVKTLTSTLKSIESMAKDASLFTGDEKVMTSMKRLIEAMSRIMEE